MEMFLGWLLRFQLTRLSVMEERAQRSHCIALYPTCCVVAPGWKMSRFGSIAAGIVAIEEKSDSVLEDILTTRWYHHLDINEVGKERVWSFRDFLFRQDTGPSLSTPWNFKSPSTPSNTICSILPAFSHYVATGCTPEDCIEIAHMHITKWQTSRLDGVQLNSESRGCNCSSHTCTGLAGTPQNVQCLPHRTGIQM